MIGERHELSQPLKIFGTLVKEVVQSNLCMFCGACIAACPVNVLFPTEDEKPTIKGICVLCQLCYYSCPRVELPRDGIETWMFKRARSKEETDLGIIRESHVARSKDEAVLKVVQNGGVVTSLLAHAIDTGLVDYAVGTTRTDEKPWRPVPIEMKRLEQLLAAAGTKCSASASLSKVKDAALGYPDSKLAFVGLPCQIQALRRVSTSTFGPRKLGEWVELAIGLFCNNSYHHNKLVIDYLKARKNIDLQATTKMSLQARDGRLRVYQGERVVLESPTKEIEPCLLEACSKCDDFTSELADISVGADGAPDGWCVVLVRTEKGERLVRSAVEKNIIEAKPIAGDGLSLVREISSRKKGREAKYISHSSVTVPD